MEPILKEGKIVLAKNSRNFQNGDIVIARIENKEVVKVVKKLKTNSLYLAGIKEKHDIGWVKKNQIKGKLVWPRR